MKDDKEIKQKKLESVLLELITEGLSELNDPRLKNLSVTRVQSSRGKYDARVFLNGSSLELAEQKEILKQIKRAESTLREYCLQATNWFRCPKFHFEFDKQPDQKRHLDALFEQIKQERLMTSSQEE